MEFLWLKWLHILSATLLFGTGLGTAYYKWSADRSGDVRAIAVVMRRVVLADWLFTATTVVIQPLTGLRMAQLAGYPLASGWVAWSLILYVLAGLCWLPVVWLQLRMRDMAVKAAIKASDLPDQYHRFSRIWFWLGIPAFGALIVVYYLMVFRPAS
jgi:uncharacterized membrane protein